MTEIMYNSMELCEAYNIAKGWRNMVVPVSVTATFRLFLQHLSASSKDLKPQRQNLFEVTVTSLSFLVTILRIQIIFQAFT